MATPRTIISRTFQPWSSNQCKAPFPSLPVAWYPHPVSQVVTPGYFIFSSLQTFGTSILEKLGLSKTSWQLFIDVIDTKIPYDSSECSLFLSLRAERSNPGGVMPHRPGIATLACGELAMTTQANPPHICHFCENRIFHPRCLSGP